MRPTEQIYSNYTTEDFSVWKLLYNRQMQILSPVVSKYYLDAIDAIGFSATTIPDFSKINQTLAPMTGWSLKVVPNISPQKEFFEALAGKQFTATCWLRSMEQLDYLEEPDMFHDVFAHAPLLCNKDYVGFFKGLSDIALEHINNPAIIELLSRIYWFTIEFGLIKEDNVVKIYGAGIISSNGETKHVMSNDPMKYDFNIQKMLNTPYRTDILQDTYFVIDSFQQLYASLPLIRKELEKISQSITEAV